MWHIIYLGIVNVIVGATTGYVIRRRAQWVREQMDEGYDFKTVRPPSIARQVPMLKPAPVDVGQLCETIQPGWGGSAQLEELTSFDWSPMPLSQEAVCPSETPQLAALSSSLVDDRELEPLKAQDFSNDSQLTEFGKQQLQSPGNESSMEVIDLQERSAESEEEESSGGHDGPALAEEEAIDQNGDVYTGPEEVPVTGDATQSPAGESEADPQGDQDFLQRISSIERLLKLAVDEDAEEAEPLVETSQQVIKVADYWETFRDSAQKILELQKVSLQSGVPATLEKLIEQVNHQVNNCRDIANQAVVGTVFEHEDVASQLRDGLLHAAKGSHQLRDQLAMSVAFPTSHFSQCTPQGLPHYYEGLSGLSEVLETWQQQEDPNQIAGWGLIDFDDFRTLNQKFGLEQADQVLVAASELISQAIRHNRGYDRLVRVGGQQFLIFFGYTPAEKVCYALERLRQLFEQTRFEIQGEKTTLTIRATAADYEIGSNAQRMLNRLREGLELAAQNGGNTVLLGTSAGFQSPGELPHYELPSQSISIAEPVAVAGGV